MPLDVLEDLKAVLPGHMEVEQQQVGGAISDCCFLESGDGLVAIVDGLKIVRDSGAFHCNFDEVGGGPIVLRKHNPSRSSVSVIRNHAPAELRSAL